MINLAIFASGSGSNAENIVHYFKKNKEVNISMFLTNNTNAGVIERGMLLNIPTLLFSKSVFQDASGVLEILQKQKIDFVILAGFLWLVPQNLVEAFPNRIINIHPSLLPKYGGKGMWGHHVHESVVLNGETESGITIHYVNEKYDEGQIIFQAKCKVSKKDNAEDLADKIHKLEFEHFPKEIEKIINSYSTSS